MSYSFMLLVKKTDFYSIWRLVYGIIDILTAIFLDKSIICQIMYDQVLVSHYVMEINYVEGEGFFFICFSMCCLLNDISRTKTNFNIFIHLFRLIS